MEAVYVERGTRYSYAAGADRPGWCRHAGRSGDPLLELLACGPRYRDAMAEADIAFDPPADLDALQVVEDHPGDSGTEFGVPSIVVPPDAKPLDGAAVDRSTAALTACWATFDRAAAMATGRPLRKGPRGGGRDLDALMEHMIESDLAYLAKLGSRPPTGRRPSRRDDWLAIRDRAIEALIARADGREPAVPNRTTLRWPLGFYLRRAGWHATHHAWEIEGRLAPQAVG